MKQRFLFLILISLLFCGCAKESFENSNSINGDNSEDSRISLERALEIADGFFAETEGMTRTSREIANVEIIKSPATRGIESNDTLLYLVNYKDNKGFALLGTDERMHDIYAISEEGKFDINEISQYPSLYSFLQNAIIHASGALKESHETRGFSWSDGNGSTVAIVHQVQPLIKPNVAKWGQMPPFNRYCNNGQSYPGCVPVAAAIYMSYFKWPNESVAGVYDWDKMIENDDTDEVAKLLKSLGHRDLFNCSYSSTGGDVDNDSIAGPFTRLGYTLNPSHTGKAVSEWFDSMISLIKKGSAEIQGPVPVLVWGDNALNLRPTDRYVAHLFVVDGEITRRYISRMNGTVVFMRDMPTLIHVIWGWEGRYNGYYVYDCTFNEIKSSVETPDNPEYEGSSLPDGYRYIKYLYYGGMYPNNK